MYIYTVNDHYERIALEIWGASKKEDRDTFNKCIDKLKSLKLTAVARSEYAKAALQGAAVQMETMAVKMSRLTYEQSLAEHSFAIADAMLAEEAKSR